MRYTLAKLPRGARNLADPFSDKDSLFLTYNDLADYFNPFEAFNTTQVVEGKDDVTKMDVKAFMVQLAKGSPEFVELLFVNPDQAKWFKKNPFTNFRNQLLNKNLAKSYLRSAKGLMFAKASTEVEKNKNKVDAYRRVLMAAQTLRVMEGNLPAKLWTPFLPEDLAKTLREVRRSSFVNTAYDALVLSEVEKMNRTLETFEDVSGDFGQQLFEEVFNGLFN